MMLMLLLLLPRPADEDTADTRPRRMGRICKAAWHATGKEWAAGGNVARLAVDEMGMADG